MASTAKVFTSSVVMGLSRISFSLFQASSSYVLKHISRMSFHICMALYLRQNSSSHFNIRVRNVTYEFTFQHSSL